MQFIAFGMLRMKPFRGIAGAIIVAGLLKESDRRPSTVFGNITLF